MISFVDSVVRASSEVQTQTNCYMYAILLPVIRVTRWSNCGQCMCGDWWISILGLCQFLCVCGLSILAVILIKGNEKRNRKRYEKASKYDLTQDKNKEQVDFVHLIIESRSNLTIGLFILWMDYWIYKPNHFSIHEFISPLAPGTLDMLWL